MFGKIMSVSDDLMWRYFELLSFKPVSEIKKYEHEISAGKNPRDVKFDLALEIISRFHSVDLALKAKQDFIERFQKGNIPEDIPELTLTASAGEIMLPNLLKEANLVKSTTEGRKMIQQGAVKIDGEKVSDSKMIIKSGTQHIYQVGKRRFANISLLP